jgi:RNA polymerase sigma factor (sigma-70 family)
VSGCPALAIDARNFRVAPNSTVALFTGSPIRTSLPTDTLALAVFVASARLVAVTCAPALPGKSAGAVYTPAVVIVPTTAFPPTTPSTLHVTLVATTEDLAASSEFQAHLDRAVEELSPKLRLVLLLAAMEGHTTEEVAAMLAIPTGTVKSRLSFARKQLAEKLQCYVNKTKKS